MSSRWKIIRHIACCATIVVAASSSMYAQSPESQQNSSVRPQMKVIEVTPQTRGTNHFTVVGAVRRSGVFTSDKNRIPLSDLIKAAWGLTDSARSSIRVIRGGQDRFRLLYEPEKATQQFVQANDVIVVLPKASVQTILANSPVIPVACFGLAHRPVVLALTPEIRTIDDLLLSLKQPAQVRSTVKIMDPYGRGKTTNLAPGSVIFFDEAAVDRRPFDSPESFPPTASLEETIPGVNQKIAESGLPEINPGIAHDSLATEQSSPESLPSTPELPNLQPLLSNVVQQSQLPKETSPLFEPPKVSSRDLFSASPIGIVSPLDNSKETLEPHETTFHQQPEIDLPLLNDRTSQLGSENDSVANHHLPAIAPAPPALSGTGQSKSRSNELHSTSLSIATRQPNENSSGLMKEENHAVNLTSLARQVPGIPESKVDSTSTGNSILPIALGVAFLGMFCLAGAILWSRHDHKIEKHQVRVTTSKKFEEKLIDPETDKSQLAFILNPSTPIIEEEVILPTEAPIHGEPVGHRRIIVQERHEKISGPHFGRKNRSTQNPKPRASNSAISPGESVSKTSQQTNSPNEHVNLESQKRTQDPVVHPVEETIIGSYDVVEPDSKVAAPQSKNGALERALFALAAEKKQ